MSGYYFTNKRFFQRGTLAMPVEEVAKFKRLKQKSKQKNPPKRARRHRQTINRNIDSTKIYTSKSKGNIQSVNINIGSLSRGQRPRTRRVEKIVQPTRALVRKTNPYEFSPAPVRPQSSSRDKEKPTKRDIKRIIQEEIAKQAMSTRGAKAIDARIKSIPPTPQELVDQIRAQLDPKLLSPQNIGNHRDNERRNDDRRERPVVGDQSPLSPNETPFAETPQNDQMVQLAQLQPKQLGLAEASEPAQEPSLDPVVPTTPSEQEAFDTSDEEYTPAKGDTEILEELVRDKDEDANRRGTMVGQQPSPDDKLFATPPSIGREEEEVVQRDAEKVRFSAQQRAQQEQAERAGQISTRTPRSTPTDSRIPETYESDSDEEYEEY
jgi:hypothetical protein